MLALVLHSKHSSAGCLVLRAENLVKVGIDWILALYALVSFSSKE